MTAGSAVADDTQIGVIDLKHRSAADLIPLLEPMLAPQGAITGTGFQLIVRTTPANRAQLEALVAELDTPPKRLMITVHMGELNRSERFSGSVSADQQRGEVRIRTEQPAGAERGLVIVDETEHGSVGATVHSTRRLRDTANRQTIQTLEGQPAYIATGIAFPYVDYVDEYRYPDGRGRSAGITYQQTATGFYARAEVHGDRVTLDISPRKETLSRSHAGVIHSTSASTRLSGALGEWIAVGSSGDTAGDRDSGYTRTQRTHDSTSQQIWLKVDALN